MNKTKTYKVQEYGLQNTVTGQAWQQMDHEMVISLVKTQLLRDVAFAGYTTVAEPEWQLSHWFKFTEYTNDEGETEYSTWPCDIGDEGALAHINMKVKVIKK